MNTTPREPRLFHLVRHHDVSGVSGTGAVAEGVEWSDGGVALRWRGRWSATSIWETGLEAVLAVHGHEGATVVRWLRPPVPPPVPVAHSPTAGLRVPPPSADGRCARCGRDWPCLTCADGVEPRVP
jgi:hypothetical protein